MSYQVKKTAVSMASGVVLLAAYGIWAMGQVKAGTAAAGDLKFWAGAMLVFIGIGVASSIVIQIVFHVFLSVGIAVKKQMRTGKCDDREVEREIKQEMVEDEMDKLIDLKSTRIGFIVSEAGVLAAIVSLALGLAPVAMLNIVFASLGLGSMAEGAARICYYKRGVANGR